MRTTAELVLVALCLLAVSCGAEPKFASQIKEISELGGNVEYEPSADLEFVFIGEKAGDADLERLLPILRNYQGLGLSSRTTNAGMAAVGELKQLRWLIASNSRIDDAGFKHLEGLKNLELLNISFTNVSDESIPLIEKMKNLKMLFVESSRITAEGKDRLLKSFPNLESDDLSIRRFQQGPSVD